MSTNKNLPACFSRSAPAHAFVVALGLIAALNVIIPLPALGVVYVNRDALGANDGSSWADAYELIQLGINDAYESDEEVWVAQGIYFEAIVMKSGVKLYGGFNGTETSRSERNWTTNVTTIDGSTARNGSPAYHVVTMDSITSSMIDGFTIMRAYANGTTDADKRGGGIYCSDLNDTNIIANNMITGNSVTSHGGGIFCYQSSPIITGNTMLRNFTSSQGGGIACYHSSPTIMNNAISGNMAYVGGGIYCTSSAPTIMNNTISENSGGGIYLDYSSSTIANNTISGNLTRRSGGGISCGWHSSSTITNNTITGNSAGSAGGAISCSGYSAPTIMHNTISGNSANYDGGGIYSSSSSSPIITNNTISGNSAFSGGGISCSQSFPTITNNMIAGNSAGQNGGGIYCFYASPTIANNAISGSSAENGSAMYCYHASPLVISNTIFGNWASLTSGGIHCTYYSSPVIKNAIFSNNNKYDIYEWDTSSDPLVSFNNFYSNSDGVYYDEGVASYTSVLGVDSDIAECSNNIGLDPLFVGDTLSGGTWTAEADYNSNTFQTTLTNSYASWIENEHAGRLLNPDTAQNMQSVALSNTETTINVLGDVTKFVQVGDTYKILDYHLQNIYNGYPADSPSIDAGDPADDYTNEPEPNGWRINQGRYGNTSEAARSSVPPPTPTRTPTPTPTPVVTPSTTSLVIQYTFTSSLEGWSFLPISGLYFSAASSSYIGGRLGISSPNDTTNRVGLWNGALDIPYAADYVYRGRYVVSSSQAYAPRNPDFRMRWTQDQSLESSSHYIHPSGSYSHSLPTDPTTREYSCYFAPTVSGDLGVAFDMVDFNMYLYGTHYVDSVTVEWFPRPTTGTVVKTYSDGDDFANWNFMTNVGGYGPVTSDGSGTGTLCITSGVDDSSNYGVWQSSGIANELTYEADKLYRATFTLRCESESARNDMPQVRLRCQNEDGQMTQTMELNSQGTGGPGAMPAVGGTDYDVYWETPTLPGSPTTGQDGFIVVIDMLDFDAAKGGTIYLDSVTVDYLEIP